jgi:Protein of unknown function (DUF732)
MYSYSPTWNWRHSWGKLGLEAKPPVWRINIASQGISPQGAPEMVTRLLVAMAAASIGLLIGVPAAHADTTDDNFLAQLKSEGITDHVSTAHAIEAAHFVCVKLDNGASPTAVVNDVLNSSSMPVYHCGFFVGASIDAYCPRHKPEIPTG